MANGQVLRLLFVSWVLQTGLPALIETQQTVMAAEGEEAQLNCKLMQEKDVLQVTWQKISPEGKKNLATYGKNFGLKVNKEFQGKMKVKNAGLQNCSIVIRKVMDEDEGCYRCLFNTYPEGALIGTTCLQLWELHGPVLHVRVSPAETVVSCWATGRPAPTVTLSVPHSNSTSVPNTNGTVTVSTTAELPRLRQSSTQVTCTAHIPSGPQMEASAEIPVEKQSPDDDLITSLSVLLPCVVAALIIFIISIIFIIFLLVRKHQNRNSEEEKTPQKPTKDTHEVRTPLMKKLNEVWLQMSSGKKSQNPKSDTHEVITPSNKPKTETRLRMSSVKKGKSECSNQKSPSIRRNLNFN